jgi:Spy/CpxP family protein refolding chaperone
MISKRLALAASAAALAAVAVVAPPLRSTPVPPDPTGGLDQIALFADDVESEVGPGDAASADDGGGPAFDGPRRRFGRRLLGARRLADYLDMSEQQRESARQLMTAQRDRVRPLIDERRALRERLRTILGDPGTSDVAVGQLVKQMHANREALKAAREAARGQLAAILDDAQRAKLETLRSVMRGLAEGGRRHRDFRR